LNDNTNANTNTVCKMEKAGSNRGSNAPWRIETPRKDPQLGQR
jgi:hypothetical protein